MERLLLVDTPIPAHLTAGEAFMETLPPRPPPMEKPVILHGRSVRQFSATCWLDFYPASGSPIDGHSTSRRTIGEGNGT